jgi:hypothetical protein
MNAHDSHERIRLVRPRCAAAAGAGGGAGSRQRHRLPSHRLGTTQSAVSHSLDKAARHHQRPAVRQIRSGHCHRLPGPMRWPRWRATCCATWNALRGTATLTRQRWQHHHVTIAANDFQRDLLLPTLAGPACANEAPGVTLAGDPVRRATPGHAAQVTTASWSSARVRPRAATSCRSGCSKTVTGCFLTPPSAALHPPQRPDYLAARPCHRGLRAAPQPGAGPATGRARPAAPLCGHCDGFQCPALRSCAAPTCWPPCRACWHCTALPGWPAASRRCPAPPCPCTPSGTCATSRTRPTSGCGPSSMPWRLSCGTALASRQR